MLGVGREDRTIARNYLCERKRPRGGVGGLGEEQEAKKTKWLSWLRRRFWAYVMLNFTGSSSNLLVIFISAQLLYDFALLFF